MAGKPLSGPELTIDELESSSRLQSRNLLDIAKSPKLNLSDDTFALSQSAGSSGTLVELQSGRDQPNSAISMRNKKPPASPSMSSQSQSEKKVHFAKEPATFETDMSVPIPAKTDTAVSPVERLHKECPCCTCHLKETSLRTQSMLQSIPEQQELDPDLQSMALLSGLRDPLAASVKDEDSVNPSLQFLSKLKSRFLEPVAAASPAATYSPAANYSPTERFVPLSMRPENSPSRIFRARLNQRFLKHVEDLDRFKVPSAAETYQATLKVSSRSKSSSSLMTMSLLP